MMSLLKRLFTLVELLVVVSIMAVLLSLLLPSLAKCKEASRKMTCTNNLRQMGIALCSYAGDNEEWLPVVFVPGYTSKCLFYDNEYVNYLGLIPSYTLPRKNAKITECPSQLVKDVTWINYGANHRLNRPDQNWGGRITSSKFSRPSEILAICDSTTPLGLYESYVDRADPRHSAWINICFLDFHVASVKGPLAIGAVQWGN